MKAGLLSFPTEVRADIASISDNGGVLSAGQCRKICEQLAISTESLMIKLLPVAADYSLAPISAYKVGAVVRGIEKNHDGMANLYLGANLEFVNQALCYSVHAEQAAISNAWLHQEPGVSKLAVSAPPCGHCRQFLYEIAGDNAFPILFPIDNNTNSATTTTINDAQIESTDLSQLLPAAFGPKDLGCTHLLMQGTGAAKKLTLVDSTDDKLVALAVSAANLSYAPYSGNYAGCALLLSNGNTVVGRYAENAAYNPSLPALSAALSQWMLSNSAGTTQTIERAVLVEVASKSCQKQLSEILLGTFSKTISLEYFSAIKPEF